jgi:hypothetical protein
MVGHFGLLGMRERAARIGARFEIESRPGAGTCVVMRCPKGSVSPRLKALREHRLHAQGPDALGVASRAPAEDKSR